MNSAANAQPRPASERIRFRILVPLLLALGTMLAAFVYAFHRTQARQSSLALARSAAEVQNLFQVEQAHKVAVMTTMLAALFQDDRLAEAFGAHDRDRVLDRVKSLYESLALEHRITHFYFHDANRVNWLRVHRLQEHGDRIDRFTLLEAERTGRVASGLEAGPLGKFVLRVVAPWRHEGRLLGYVELGTEFEVAVEEVRGLLQVDFVAAVYKRFLDRGSWDRAMKNSGPTGASGDWDQFPTTVVTNMTFKTMPGPVRACLAGLRDGRPGANQVVDWEGRNLQLMFLPLTDVTGRMLGELIVVQDVTETLAQARKSIRFTGGICLIVGTVLAGLFSLFLTRIEQDLAGRTAKLKAEILERQRAEADLDCARAELEQRVADRTRELKEANAGLNQEIASKEKAQRDLEDTHRQLMDTSRQAGMAEVATSVLHNVGNVLNSVNVSATLAADHVRRSKVSNVARLRDLLHQHRGDLGRFLTEDPKGRMIPAYLDSLAESLTKEQAAVIAELSALRNNIDHIKDVVAMQQSYAKTSGVTESISVPDLVEDALRMNAGSLARHDVDVARDYAGRPVITVEKNKVLQILVNLIRNAKYACDESGRTDKLILLRTTTDERGVEISVIDNGVGIPAENLTRIFAHGFTTRKHGHGFGLHSGALAARELGGSLTVRSDGPGKGATFTLRLPYKSDGSPS